MTRRLLPILAAALLALPTFALAADTATAVGNALEGGTSATQPTVGSQSGNPADAAADAKTPFAGTIAQSVAALLVFGIVFFVLKQKAWGPILQGLQDREDKIRKDLTDAESTRAAAQAKLDEYNRELGGAEARIRELFAKATDDAEALRTRMKAQAQQEVEADKERATREIESAKNAALADVREQAAELSTAIAEKILRRNLSVDDQRELVRASLAEMGTSLNGNGTGTASQN